MGFEGVFIPRTCFPDGMLWMCNIVELNYCTYENFIFYNFISSMSFSDINLRTSKIQNVLKLLNEPHREKTGLRDF